MRKGKKIALWAAGILIVLGAVLGVGATLLGDLTLESLDAQELVTETVPIHGDFKNISINDSFSNIHFLPSEDDTCKLVFTRLTDVTYSAEVEGDTLTILGQDGREWYEMIQFGSGSPWGDLEMVVYLPKTQYGDLTILSGAGNLNIPENFVFDTAFLVTASGCVTFRGGVERTLTLQTASGDILAENVRVESLTANSSSGTIALNTVTVGENLSLDTTSGDVDLTAVECGELRINSTSGEVECQNVLAGRTMQIQTASGEIDVVNCDASHVKLTSSSGDITGTLRTPKVYHADSDSGNVEVPRTTTGGPCEIYTSSGDIHFEEFVGTTG